MIIVENMYELYKKYMTLPIYDVNDFIDSEAEKYMCNRVTICDKVKKYAIQINDEEDFLKRQTEVLICKKEYVKSIKKYLDKKDINEILKLGDKSKILEYLKRYLKLYPNEENQISELMDKINEQEVILTFKEKLIIDGLYNTSQYFSVMKSLIFCNNELEAIMRLRRFHLSERVYNTYLEEFKRKYPNEEEYYNYLKKLYSKYVKYFNTADKTKNKYNNKISKLNLLEDVLNSNLSIEEYCSKKVNISVSSINEAITSIKYNSDLDYEEIKKELMNRDNTNFYNNMKNIIYGIINQEYDAVDYFLATKLNLDDFLKISKTLLDNPMYIKKVSEFVSKTKKILNLGTGSCSINKIAELNGTKIIGGYEVTREEKESAFSFLEINEIPINLYNVVLRNMLNSKKRGGLND